MQPKAVVSYLAIAVLPLTRFAKPQLGFQANDSTQTNKPRQLKKNIFKVPPVPSTHILQQCAHRGFNFDLDRRAGLTALKLNYYCVENFLVILLFNLSSDFRFSTK